MSLKEQITQDLKEAMRAKDSIRLEAVRGIRAEILKMDKGGVEGGATDELILQSVKKLIKEHQELIEAARKNERPDIYEDEEKIVAALKIYLPAAMSAEELSQVVEAAVTETAAQSMKDMGRVLETAQKAVQQSGKDADSRALAELIKKRLS